MHVAVTVQQLHCALGGAKRVAAAVGEGAQVVTALHAFLATLDAQTNLSGAVSRLVDFR